MNPDSLKPRSAKPCPTLAPLDIQQRYTVAESALYLRSSLWSVFRDIREGRLTVIREGARTFIPGSEIARRSRIDPEAFDQRASA